MRTGFDKTRWEAWYDVKNDSMVGGEWSTAAGGAGVFQCERTTDERMRNRAGPSASRAGGPTARPHEKK